MRWTLLYYLLHFQFLFSRVFSAPTESQEPLGEGDIVRVHQDSLAQARKSTKSSFHPGVIVSKSEDRCHKVAIISSLHPDKPPIRPIKDFLPKNYVDLLDGNVNLGPPEVILRKNLRRWHPDKTDKSIRVKIDPDNLAKLKEQMKEHADWIPTTHSRNRTQQPVPYPPNLPVAHTGPPRLPYPNSSQGLRTQHPPQGGPRMMGTHAGSPGVPYHLNSQGLGVMATHGRTGPPQGGSTMMGTHAGSPGVPYHLNSQGLGAMATHGRTGPPQGGPRMMGTHAGSPGAPYRLNSQGLGTMVTHGHTGPLQGVPNPHNYPGPLQHGDPALIVPSHLYHQSLQHSSRGPAVMGHGSTQPHTSLLHQGRVQYPNPSPHSSHSVPPHQGRDPYHARLPPPGPGGVQYRNSQYPGNTGQHPWAGRGA